MGKRIEEEKGRMINAMPKQKGGRVRIAKANSFQNG